MKIVEIFHSIQGEGKNAGINSIFLRTSGCNLNCSFCDTQYHREGQETDLQEALKKVLEIDSYNLVITGGEPLLWQKQLYEIIKDIPHYVTIETNGTIVPQEEMLERVDEWSVSPKLASSGNDIDKRLNYDALSIMNDFNCNFKFVISSENDIDEVNKIVEQLHLPNSRIWLMPEGQTPDEITEKSPWVVELCKKYNYNFSPRLHILIWGKKRGV